MLASSRPDEFGGVPTQRYLLRVQVTEAAGDPIAAAELRALGITTIDVDMFVNAQDQIVGCGFAAALPGGNGAVTADLRFGAFGEPVEIVAPPEQQVLRLPAGGG